MKNIKTKIGLVLALFVLVASCDKDFLNTSPLDKISSDATWSDGALSEAFIYNVYSDLGYGGFEEQGQAAITDEAMFTHAGRNINTFTEGTESPANRAWFSATYEWDNMYSAIRKANIALTSLPTSTFDDDGLREKLIGEAHFLRAYYYHQLVRFYGGVPLISEPYGLDQDYNIARNSYEECIDFIIADLDKATSMLSGKTVIDGRASDIAALALKARVLLYAASDSHVSGKVADKSGGFSNMDLIAYSGGDQNARYMAAKNAAKAVLDATSGYKMDLTAPVSAEEGKANYVSLAMGGGSAAGDAGAAVELIFQRTATPLYTVEDNWPLGGLHTGINNGPNGYHNWAGNTPIQALVDDYEMMDGSSFDWTNDAHSADPYANRDPRFYSTVLYDGADWKPRPADVAPRDPSDQIQTGQYDDGNGGIINGLDTRQSPVEDWNGSRTHYYVRKFIDPDPSLADNQSSSQVIPWPFIRYAEMALSYAEASFKTGDEDAARTWLNKIRFRVGMPAVTESGSDLWAKIINERRIELAYEEHRYHDARRWLIAEETLGRGIEQVDISAKLKAGASAHQPYKHDKSVYDYTYTVVSNTENETRKIGRAHV